MHEVAKGVDQKLAHIAYALYWFFSCSSLARCRPAN